MTAKGGVGQIAICVDAETSCPQFFICVYGNFRENK